MTGRRVGAWLIGARGSISTCVVYGAALLQKKLIQPTGCVTARGISQSIGFVPFDQFIFAGHETRNTTLHESAEELVKARILSSAFLKEGDEFAAEVDKRVRPGFSSGRSRDTVKAIQADLLHFKKAEKLDSVIVVNLASTEAFCSAPESWNRLDTFLEELDHNAEIPMSVLYAYAAIDAGCAYVNFTPSLGAAIPALQELAIQKKIPHCGRDGKTGETLIKTALAPMFRARNLRVMSWEGYNLLGNRDGQTLSDPKNRESKIKSKDEALRQILEEENLHTRVSIDYVPSLDDWKTAWDYIHFQGFLDVPMSLQFTWQGSDSALAAPLVFDLLRLTEFAHRQGESGVMKHVASFFKSPLGVKEQDFHKQVLLLEEYLRPHAAKHS